VYPKPLAPLPPAHPHCRCLLAPRLDLTERKGELREGAETAWLRQSDHAQRIVGSRAKWERVKKGADPMAVAYENVEPDYRPRTVAEAAGVRQQPLTKPKTVAPADIYRDAKTIEEAERIGTDILRLEGPVEYVTEAFDGKDYKIIRFAHGGMDPDLVAEYVAGRASYVGLDVDTANFINRYLVTAAGIADRHGIPRLRGVMTHESQAGKSYMSMGDGILSVARGSSSKKAVTHPVQWKLADHDNGQRPFIVAGFFESPAEQYRSLLWHEFGHHVHQQLGVINREQYRSPPLELKIPEAMRNARKNYFGPGWGKKDPVQSPSEYAKTNSNEFFAESYSLFRLDRRDLVPGFLVPFLESIEKGLMP
jgi:hypothetical protein